MAHAQVTGDTSRPGDQPDGQPSYEPPRLTPIGNLHDLLAGGGSQCDALGDTGRDSPGGC
jgi:hypothetical protein